MWESATDTIKIVLIGSGTGVISLLLVLFQLALSGGASASMEKVFQDFNEALRKAKYLKETEHWVWVILWILRCFCRWKRSTMLGRCDLALVGLIFATAIPTIRELVLKLLEVISQVLQGTGGGGA